MHIDAHHLWPLRHIANASERRQTFDFGLGQVHRINGIPLLQECSHGLVPILASVVRSTNDRDALHPAISDGTPTAQPQEITLSMTLRFRNMDLTIPTPNRCGRHLRFRPDAKPNYAIVQQSPEQRNSEVSSL